MADQRAATRTAYRKRRNRQRPVVFRFHFLNGAAALLCIARGSAGSRDGGRALPASGNVDRRRSGREPVSDGGDSVRGATYAIGPRAALLPGADSRAGRRAFPVRPAGPYFA